MRAGVTTGGRKVISGIVEILGKLGLGDDSTRGVLIRPQWTLHPRSLRCAVCKGKCSLGRYGTLIRKLIFAVVWASNNVFVFGGSSYKFEDEKRV